MVDFSKKTSLYKPTSNINLKRLAGAAIASTGAALIVDDDDSDTPAKIYTESLPTINLWQFIKMYTIFHIPIVDFIITFIIIYCINALCFKYNIRYMLVAAIPITIILNLFINKKVTFSWTICILLVFSIGLLIYWKANDKGL